MRKTINTFIILTLFMSCSNAQNDSPLVTVIKLQSAESTADFEAAKNYIDINVWILGLLALVLLIPSTGQVQKYLGIYGVFVYLLLGTIAILVHYKYVWPVYFSKVTLSTPIALFFFSSLKHSFRLSSLIK